MNEPTSSSESETADEGASIAAHQAGHSGGVASESSGSTSPTAKVTPDQLPVDRYRERAAVFVAEQRALATRSRQYTIVRGILFLLALTAALLAVANADFRVLWGCLSGVLLVAFVAICGVHERLYERLRVAQEQEKINLEGLARIERRWSELPVPQVDRLATYDSEIRDLDVLGRASLFQLVCRANTPLGMRRLRDWLLHPAAPDELARRQTAVSALREDWVWREQLQLRGRLLSMARQGPDALLHWADSDRWLEHRPGLLWAARLSPLVLAVCVVLTLLHIVPLWLGGTLLGAIIVGNVTLSILFAGTIHETFNQVSSRNNEAQIYSSMFALMNSVPEKGPLLLSLKNRAGSHDDGACEQLLRLNRIVRASNLRNSGLLTIVYVVFQATGLWDFHVLHALERWHRQWHDNVRDWLEALAELEALASLAALADDHPQWCMPQLRSQPVALEARQIGHPLIADGVRVCNDVQVGPPGSFLLVTGSNMSGKSTLLRSLGTNVLLGQAGGPVCAESFLLPPLQVATSMRVQDSLQDGVSFFMAELQRLKQVVDQAAAFETEKVQQADGDGDGTHQRTLLYLLDEILQGTNSVERHIAVQRVIRHLLDHGAIGAVSTHDLELAGSPNLVDRCCNVHFRESFAGEGQQRRMTFDYKLREGVATTTNALELLELVGIPDVDQGDVDQGE